MLNWWRMIQLRKAQRIRCELMARTGQRCFYELSTGNIYVGGDLRYPHDTNDAKAVWALATLQKYLGGAAVGWFPEPDGSKG